MIRRIRFLVVLILIFSSAVSGEETVMRFDEEDYEVNNSQSLWHSLSETQTHEQEHEQPKPPLPEVKQEELNENQSDLLWEALFGNKDQKHESEPQHEPEYEPQPEPQHEPHHEPQNEPEHEAAQPQITDEEFLKLCENAGADAISHAIENRKANVNAKDFYNVTALMTASAHNSDPDVTALLIAAGADPEARDKDGMTALMHSAKFNQNPEIIIALTEGGANVNARDRNRITPLMHASRTNNSGVVKALIDSGAEELADKRGWTALFWAARYTSDPKVIDVLLDSGADPLARAHDMTVPFDHAQKNQKLNGTEEYLRLEEESR